LLQYTKSKLSKGNPFSNEIFKLRRTLKIKVRNLNFLLVWLFHLFLVILKEVTQHIIFVDLFCIFIPFKKCQHALSLNLNLLDSKLCSINFLFLKNKLNSLRSTLTYSHVFTIFVVKSFKQTVQLSFSIV